MTKRVLTDQEKELLRQAMEGVEPLPESALSRVEEKKSATEFNKIPDKASPFRDGVGRRAPFRDDVSSQAPFRKYVIDQSNSLAEIHPDDLIEGSTPLFYLKNSLPQKTIRQLKRGKLHIESECDLHGYTVAEAENILHQFISNAIHHGNGIVSIVHGKGIPGQGAKLKTYVNAWLKDIPSVLAFCSAKQNAGGTGAVTVLLKTSKP